MHRPRLSVIVVAAAIVGMLLGLLLAPSMPGPSLIEVPVVKLPAPHQIPRVKDGMSLRFAMVHDVIHERITRHGPVYYQARNREARAGIAREQAREGPGGGASDAHLALLDDLGAGLDALGRHGDAEQAMRVKLARQQARHDRGRALHATYGNLATFIIHGHQAAARRGDPGARRRLQEALGYLKQANAADPNPLFGREQWQAVALTFTLAALDRPALLDRYDLLGDDLRTAIAPARKAYSYDWRQWRARQAEKMLRGDPGISYKDDDEFRKSITRVGAEDNWTADVPGSIKEPVAFDEPVLGMIGMWRLGAGARPQFALALGETMWRVGQKYIAWNAYERALRMADRFGPDPRVRAAFVRRCRARQAELEPLLSGRETHAELVRRFDAELAYGQRYQRQYQAFEAAQLGHGAALADPKFYEPFYATHGHVASPPGEADTAAFTDSTDGAYVLGKLPPVMAITGGICAILATFLVLFWRLLAYLVRPAFGQAPPVELPPRHESFRWREDILNEETLSPGGGGPEGGTR